MTQGFKDSNKKFRPTGNSSKGVSEHDVKRTGDTIKVKPKFVPTDGIGERNEQTLDAYKKYLKVTKPETIMLSPRIFLHATDDDPNWIPDHGIESVKTLKKRMEQNKPIDKPFLIYDSKPDDPRILNNNGAIVGHEGRHRAYVARKLKIQEIPVEVFCVKHRIFNCASCRKITAKAIMKAEPQFENKKQREDFIKKQYESNFKNWQEWHKIEDKIDAIFA